ncbi:MAG TPA: ATP-binding protein [Candidatus Margulisiibacteriota bacterium]|nr:ATP-binding protein [Candidatus Margulisiibacteriota bacterium]
MASLGDPVILTDDADHITLFNQAAEELTGVPRAHVLYRSFEEVFKSSPPIVAIVQRTRTSGQSQSCGEETLMIAQRRIPVRLSCSPLWAPNDEVQGTALVMQDLSYQKKLEDEARRSETLARLGGLVAGLAHEIKNPLGGIKGAAQLLAQRFAEQPDVHEYTGVMIREIDRLARLVEQLLTLGAPPAPTQQALNVHKIIHEVLALMQSELSAKGIVVRLQIDPSLPDVRGDEAQLTHVFLNLVKNAMEAMPEHGALTITTRMETDFHILWRAVRGGTAGGAAGSGKFLRVEVADTGPGFPESDLERVFEPFFSTKPRGTGLGLAICQRIVAAHGGDIRAENRRGGGAAVTVTLPLVGA